MGIFDKLKHGLIKTKQSFTNQVDQVLASFGKVDEDLFEELEAALITSDLGVVTAAGIIEKLRARVKSDRAVEPGEVKDILRDIISDMLVKTETEFDFMDTPIVILVIGVNGVGKTTSIGKMASIYKSNGKSVVLAAADTFRAAAIEQLTVWAERAGVMLIKQSEGSDPAAVVYDACQSAKSKKLDVLICDTAGRLHNKKNLMDELHKITKVVTREMPGVRQETYLV
ncbi:MAG: signal recognition particle receptor subunit alpha, partial [Clostridiales bacterium]|nr:signal recognition particle receptor subunit alpha [Clostridiales bacterium]